MTILDPGCGERTKLIVHAALGACALVCAGYNVCAWLRRRQGHLARNGVVYSALTIYEVAKVRHHLGDK